MNYTDFVASKICLDSRKGFDVDPECIHPALMSDPYRHQGAIVRWCLEGGCRAIFAAFGLGKTPIAGLFTVPCRAIKLGRKGRGVELNGGYFLDGVKCLRAEEQNVCAPSLLDFCKGAV